MAPTIERVLQEFYCNDCDGYIVIKLNMAINRRIDLHCPNCNRRHPRVVDNGQIFERGGSNTAVSGEVEVIRPMKSAYSKAPLTQRMRDAAKARKEKRYDDPRCAVLIRSGEMDEFFRQRWKERTEAHEHGVAE